jgi:hypothetical protein
MAGILIKCWDKIPAFRKRLITRIPLQYWFKSSNFENLALFHSTQTLYVRVATLNCAEAPSRIVYGIYTVPALF